MLEHLTDNLDVFACPKCRGKMRVDGTAIVCSTCNASYGMEHGIPLLFVPNRWDASKEDVTDTIKAFYEETPFPNYEDFETVSDLIRKAQSETFARMLNEQVPFNIRVLEVGCGTGQLTNFLGIAHRTVFGADVCLNSLRLGSQFKRANSLDRVGFYQMNLFRPPFREESFSLVISNGVLHHTSDPFGGFQSISKLVTKGGYIIIGLYNTYGRLITDSRRMVFRLFNNRFKFLDPRLRDVRIGDVRRLTWFMDQYKNPHESKHSIGEVLRWFDRTGFEFVGSIPKSTAFDRFTGDEKLFLPKPRGNWLDHFFVQTSLVFTGSEEGGFFVMIGRRKP